MILDARLHLQLLDLFALDRPQELSLKLKWGQSQRSLQRGLLELDPQILVYPVLSQLEPQEQEQDQPRNLQLTCLQKPPQNFHVIIQGLKTIKDVSQSVI